MENEEMKKHILETSEESKQFKMGFFAGRDYAQRLEKRNKMLETLLMEMTGHEKEWLITNSGYKKLKKDDLIQIIMEQRQLMKMLFENLDDEKQEEFKHIVNKVVWNNYEEELI